MGVFPARAAGLAKSCQQGYCCTKRGVAVGGRTRRDEYPDRESWITEVSDQRLEQYRQLTYASGFNQRIDGASRSGGQQSYFTDLIERERARRQK